MLRKYIPTDVKLLRDYVDDIKLAASTVYDIPFMDLKKNKQRKRVMLARQDVVEILLNTVDVDVSAGTITIERDGFVRPFRRLSASDIAELINLKSHSSALVIVNKIDSNPDRQSDMTFTEYLLQLQSADV